MGLSTCVGSERSQSGWVVLFAVARWALRLLCSAGHSSPAAPSTWVPSIWRQKALTGVQALPGCQGQVAGFRSQLQNGAAAAGEPAGWAAGFGRCRHGQARASVGHWQSSDSQAFRTAAAQHCQPSQHSSASATQHGGCTAPQQCLPVCTTPPAQFLSAAT